MLSNSSNTPTMEEVVQSRTDDAEVVVERPIRVFLVDDHEIVRDGLRALIDSCEDLEVVGEASTVADALTRLDSARPDVAVVDLFLPDGDGVQVCREARTRRPELHCLILTSFSDDEALFDAIMAGAAGYVLKGARSGELLDSIRQVAAGRSLLDPAVTARVFEMFRTGRETDRRLAALSQQERRVLDLLSEGLTYRQIATRLNLAEKTVKNYVSNLLMKMGFRRRTEAATYAARLAERRTRRAPAPLVAASQLRR